MQYFDLTTAQKSIDALQSFYEGTSISVICGAVIFDSLLDRTLLTKAANIVIKKHEAFRLRFVTKNGKTVQYVGEDAPEADFEEFSSHKKMQRFCERQARTPFEANGSAMFRMTVFEIPDHSGVILAASHLISDAWTYSIIANDLFTVYGQLCAGEPAENPAVNFTEFAAKDREYLSSEKYTADRSYWTEKYSGCISETPIRICRKTNVGAAAKRYSVRLSDGLSRSIDEFCSENGISSAALFETAVIVYLAKINSDRSAVTIGVPVLGRSSAKEKKAAGLFMSTIPLTVPVNADEAVLSLVRRTAKLQREIFRHRKFPYSEILRIVRKSTAFSGRLFDVMVSCQNAETGIHAKTEWFSNGFSEVPFTFHTDKRDGSQGYTVNIDYQTDIFPQEAEIRLVSERIFHIIRQMISDKETALRDISVLPDSERKLLLYTINDTAADVPQKRVHEAFSEMAAKYPNKTALVFGSRKYTYDKLEKMSDALSHYLCDNGIAGGDIVPIISRRSPFIIIAMLAILKAGAAYMPVSPDYPDSRIKLMTESVSAKLALTCGCEFSDQIRLDTFDYSYTSQASLPTGSPDDKCYVIFTSGSTGKPKGTVISHRNVINYCAANRFNVVGKIIGEGDSGIVSVTDIVFDIFVTETLLPLLNGIVIYLANDVEAVSQKALSKLVSESGAKIIQTTPTKMRGFLLDRSNLGYLSSFSKIILGGEEFSAELCKRLKCLTNAEIYNVYGPAETTVWSTAARADENDITIGGPIANTRIYIMDDSGQLLPAGVCGEICISGMGVGKGYLNVPELTAERFIPDKFFAGDTVYRTGDMGLIRADGCIEFFGRRDNQIKLRGLRIELGEIESVLGSFEGICHAAVVCRTDEKGNKYLAAYYTSETDIDEKQLRLHISRKLPAYMIPNVFTRLAAMPMTASGKISRNDLPEPERIARAGSTYSAPTNEAERTLCRIMAKVLNCGRVGTEDDFFELGGDSLSAMEFAAIAENKGFSMTAKTVYDCRTVKKLCRHQSENRARSKPAKSFGKFPLRRTSADIFLFRRFVDITKTLYDFKVTGLERLDLKKRYIFCPNHESDLDCMWVLSALSERTDINDCCALIAAEHLDEPLHRLCFRMSGGIPIERQGDFAPALRRALSVLKSRKRFLVIHPEGTRTRSGRLGKFKQGAALIAKRSGVKVVPVYIEGAREIYPVYRKLPYLFSRDLKRFPLHITFGAPIDPAGRTAEQLTEEIRRQIILMKGKGSERLGNRNRR